jgi:hypothetical protein
MDCKTARLLLDYMRPQAAEMDAAEMAALEQHLTGCSECDAAARAERNLDRALAKAIQAVEVPAALRTRLLVQLEKERGDVYLRWFGHVGRVAAAAAAILLLVWGIVAWRQSHLPSIDMDQAWSDLQAARVTPPNGDALADHFRRLGFDGPFPRDLNYSLLTYYGMGEFQGRQVPQLIFITAQGDAHAEVRLISGKQFNLTNLPTGFQSPDGYPYKIAVWQYANEGAEVVDYTGGDANWLRQERSADDGRN